MKPHQPDDRLPGLELLLNTSALLQRIGPWVGTGKLSIANIRYKPGTSCLVSYKLISGGETKYLHAKAFEPADWLIRRHKITAPSWVDNEFSFAVFKFPLDAELEGLRKFATSPDGFLSRLLIEEFSHLSLRSYDVLAYKPNRRFVARLNFSTGHECVMKLHDKSTFQDALVATAALKKLAIAGKPGRCGKSARHRALAYHWIPGSSLDVAGQNVADRRSTMEQVFDLLQELHRPVDTLKVKLRERMRYTGLVETARDLSEICPPLASRAQRVAFNLLANETDEHLPRLTHGDFYDRQLIVQSNIVRACDFDNCCIDDPTVDLANFVAHLDFRACFGLLRDEIVDDIHDQCLNSIARIDGRPAVTRYRWNRAACLFRLATRPFRSGSESWIDDTELLLGYVSNLIRSVCENGNTSRNSVIRPVMNRDETHRSFDSDRLTEAIHFDSKFDFLSDTFVETVASKVLKAHLPKLRKKFGGYTVNRVLPRRHKIGRRCLIEFELATDNGLHSILGKVSAKRLDRHASRALRDLYQKHSFEYSSNDGISVPRTLGFYEPWQMWFQEKVDAVSASEMMDRRQLNPVANQIAEAIAKLHQCNFLPRRVHSIDDELNILKDRLTRAMTECPGELRRIRQILANCISIGNGITRDSMVPIHRDFYQEQIMFASDRTYLVDLDLISLGHPALDIGNFIAHLAEHGIRIHGNADFWNDAETRLVDRYLALNSNCTRFEIESFKALSIARHVLISWSMPYRRRTHSMIIAFAEQLTDEVANMRIAGHI